MRWLLSRWNSMGSKSMSLDAKMNYETWLGIGNRILNLCQEWLQGLVPAVGTMQNDQANPKSFHILLVDDVGVHGDKDIEFRFDAFK
jgi:hypothetical protein